MAERRSERLVAGNEEDDLGQNTSSPEIPSQIVALSGETVARQLVFSLPVVSYGAATSRNTSDHVYDPATTSVRPAASETATTSRNRCEKPLQLTVQECWVQAGPAC